MPVKGTLIVAPPLSRVETMLVGDVKYIFCDDIIVTKRAIFLDLFVPVFENSDDFNGEEEDSHVIKIERIGEGLNSDDFILDVSEVPSFYVFELSRTTLYFELLQDKRDYVIFEKFDSREENFEIEEAEIDLEKSLAKALENEDFEEVIKIKKQISDRQE